IVTHPSPITLEARPVEHESTPDGGVAMAYYHDQRMVARGVVAEEAVEMIRRLLEAPVTLALAATEDDMGNIDGRIWLMIPVEAERLRPDEHSADEEPWRASVPPPPAEIGSGWNGRRETETPQMALIPLGNVVRSARNRNHPDNVAGDARE